MMGDKEMLQRLPEGWRTLFTCLHRSIELADLWYLEATQSQYGHQPEWQTLLTALQVQEPCIVNKQLVFKPRFLLLTLSLQEKFLSFMIKESCMIPNRAILQFVRTLHTLLEPGQDDSVGKLIATLKQDTQVSIDLSQRRTAADVSEPSQTRTTRVSTEQVKEPEKEHHDQVIFIDVDKEDAEPTAKRQKIDTDMTESVEHDCQLVATQADSLNETLYSQVEQESDIDVTDEIGEKMEKLKEIWQSGDATKAPEVLQEIPKLSLKEIDWFCKRLSFCEMSDDCIEIVCQHLCQLVEALSYDCVLCLLRYVMLETILKLTQAPSRKLIGAVTLIADNFPKQFIESTLVPLCSQKAVPACHVEIVCKIIKDKLSSTLRTFFIKKLFIQDFEITNDKLPVLQTIFENGFEANEEVISLLIVSFNNVAQQFAKDLKFGKLLLALINKYGKFFTSESKLKLCSTVDCHTTFLKKSINNALVKLIK